jgi:hypothetical protein
MGGPEFTQPGGGPRGSLQDLELHGVGYSINMASP